MSDKDKFIQWHCHLCHHVMETKIPADKTQEEKGEILTWFLGLTDEHIAKDHGSEEDVNRMVADAVDRARRA